ncbi:MAG: hypothetical protein WD512_17920 [Candidatus Paceibacterota bacterium]
MNKDKESLLKTKKAIIEKAVEDGITDELTNAGFFKHITQIEKSNKVRTHDKIWLGRMLKMTFGKRAPNPDGIAIFQAPDQFKEIRSWEQKQ